MTFRSLLATTVVLALTPWAPLLHAQPTVTTAVAAAAASAPASSPLGDIPGRRVLTPTEKRESSSMPGDLRPGDRVTPQIVVPLRKTPPSPAAPATRAASAPGGIDDTAARCEAQASQQARESCRARAGATSK